MSKPTVAERAEEVKSLLANRPFVMLWVAQIIAQIAQNTINFTLLIQVREIVERQQMAGQNTAISLLVLAFSVPGVLLSAVGGVVVDRSDKRRVLIFSNVLRIVVGAGFLLIDADWPAYASLALLYLLTFSLGSIGQFYGPAQLAAIPTIVKPHRLIQANALFNLTSTGTQVIGFAITGPIFVTLIGLRATFAVVIVAYVLALAATMALPSLPRYRPEAIQPLNWSSFLSEAREGMQTVFQRPLVARAVLYLSLATMTYLMVAALGPDYVVDVLGMASQDIAFVVAPAGLGVVIGAIFVNRINRRIGETRLATLALVGAGLLLATFALFVPTLQALDLIETGVPRSILACVVVCVAFLGVANAFILIPSQTLLQRATPQDRVARVFSASLAVTNILSFAPVLFAGAIADVIGVVKVLAGIGVLLAIVGIWNMVRPGPEVDPADGWEPLEAT